jgi:hypothetical protein
MAPIVASTEISRSPDDVFAYVTVPVEPASSEPVDPQPETM